MPTDASSWPPDRFPIAFHNILRDGEGGVEFVGTPWSPSTARKRWFDFVKVMGDKRVWTARISGGRLVLSSRVRETELAREAMERTLKNLPGGG